METSNEVYDQVLIEGSSHVRILTINRPTQLNALNYSVIFRLLEAFTAYEENPYVKLIILKGKGRAFSAGGDVASLIHQATVGNGGLAARFYLNEFTLIHMMASYKKPQVSILHGLILGAGAGISLHGMFRVATEKTVFAMPETTVGLPPDAGASYFLSRFPGFLGEYIALTGARLDGAEMLACGLATHFVPSASLPLLEEALLQVDTADPAVVRAVIDRFSRRVPLKERSAFHRMDTIDRCFSRRTMEEILSSLEQEAVNGADELISASIQALKKASPLSLKLFLRSIREGRLQSLEQCLVRDYRICSHVLRAEVSNDFFEGYRTVLVDKDKKPKWEPSKLELVSDEMVDEHFSKVEEIGWEDLKLPPRPTRSSHL